MAPSWLVDAAIYSEMKGGIHPWFTGYLFFSFLIEACGETLEKYGKRGELDPPLLIYFSFKKKRNIL